MKAGITLCPTEISCIYDLMFNGMIWKSLVAGIFISAFFSVKCLAQTGSDDALLRELVEKKGQAIVTVSLQDKGAINKLSEFVSISSVKAGVIEIILSPLTIDWFIDQGFGYSISDRSEPKGIITASDVSEAMQWETYPSYTQYLSIMESFESLYPEICDLDTIGTSNNGKYVLVLKISDNARTDEDEPKVFFSFTIHGNETGGFVMMLQLADYLLSNYGIDARVTRLLDELEIWINPLANPDGTYLDGNEITAPVRANAMGYDLNRNFPDPGLSNVVRQKETLDMIKFMRKHHFVISANFHSGAEVVNYPWDRWSRRHADDDWFYSISRKYADTVHQYSDPGYMVFLQDGVTNGWNWYSVSGSRQDFVNWELQGREITVELDNDFVTPAANLSLLWEYNRRSFLGFLENALYGIHGHVTDINTGLPVEAKIVIPGHDKDSSFVFSDAQTGSFTRLIAAGSWDLLFKAKGYTDLAVENVVVTDNVRTELNIQMTPYVNPVDTSDAFVMILYPNPANELLRAVLPEELYGRVNVRIFNALGIRLKDYYDEAVEDIPLEINVRDLPDGLYTLIISSTESEAISRKRFVVVGH